MSFTIDILDLYREIMDCLNFSYLRIVMGRIILKYDCNTSCVRDTFEEFFQDKNTH